MKIINHRASEGKPRTAGQVLNRATSGAICFRASKRTWACLKKLVLRWETSSYGHLISSTGVPGTSQDQSRMRVNQMTRSTWQGSTVLSGNTVQSQDSAARSRADYSHSRRTHTSPQPAGICHHLQAQSQPALGGMRSRKVKSKQFEIIHFAKLDRDLQSPLLPEISHRNSRTFCGENHFVERVQIAMKKLQQSFFFFFLELSHSPFLTVFFRIVSIWNEHWQELLCIFSFSSCGRAACTNFVSCWRNNSGVFCFVEQRKLGSIKTNCKTLVA